MEKCLQTCFENNFVVQPFSVQGQSLVGSMARRAKAKAKAVARVREEQGAEPDIEPAPIVTPMRKQKSKPTLPEPEMEDSIGQAQLPPRWEATLQERKSKLAHTMVILLQEYDVVSVPKPRLLERNTWDIFVTCLHASLRTEDFSSAETVEKLAWLHCCHMKAVGAIHDEFPDYEQVPARWEAFLKLSVIHFPMMDALRALHGQ